jgi:hypothetical protein
MPLISDRAERARVPSKTVEQAIQVFFFKKLGQHTPSGITSSSLVEFVTRQFVFTTESVKADSMKRTTKLIENLSYNVLAITALVFDTNTNTLTHHIVGVVLYMHDKHGSFVFTLGTEDQGNTTVCNLSNKFFSKWN